MLTGDIRQQHRGAVAGEARPCTCHIAIARHENHVHGNHHRAPYAREVGAPDGPVGEFIPKRQVEIYAHHNLGSHHYRHHHQPLAIVGADEVLEHIDVSHHREECQQREYHKIAHCRGIVFLVVAVGALAEHNRLVGITERLRYHGHNHGNLHHSAINAQLLLGIGSMIHKWEDDFVGGLIEYAGNAQQHHRPRVSQHLAQQFAIEIPLHRPQLGVEGKGDERGANEVDEECIALIRREAGERHDVEHDVEHDERQLERCKLHGIALISQIGKRNGLEGIE